MLGIDPLTFYIFRILTFQTFGILSFLVDVHDCDFLDIPNYDFQDAPNCLDIPSPTYFLNSDILDIPD